MSITYMFNYKDIIHYCKLKTWLNLLITCTYCFCNYYNKNFASCRIFSHFCVFLFVLVSVVHSGAVDVIKVMATDIEFDMLVTNLRTSCC